MKLTTGILVLGMTAGTVWAQNPSIIGIEKAKLNAVQKQKTADLNAALGITPTRGSSPFKAPRAATSKPAAGTPRVSSASPAPVAPQGGQSKASSVKANAAPAKTTLVSVNPVAAAPKVAAKPTASSVASTTTKKPESVAVEDKNNPQEAKKAPAKTFSMTGKRDPFLSPVVSRTSMGSGCSSGKKCLSIEQIALKGVVKGDSGMIAVVVNALDKAYFLRENDPVFNGYVVKITGDSIVFKQTLQDRLGKTFMREVTKKIPTPAV